MKANEEWHIVNPDPGYRKLPAFVDLFSLLCIWLNGIAVPD